MNARREVRAMEVWPMIRVVGCWLLLAIPAARGGDAGLGEPIETDTESGARIHRLGADERDANNIYGEQAPGDSTGRWIVVNYLNQKGDKGPCLSVIDLTDGSRRDIGPGGAAWHAWGEYVYFQREIEGKRMLRRCHFETLKVEDVAPIPAELGRLGWQGTVSPDRRYFAVCNKSDKNAPVAKVHLLDLESGKWSLLLDKPGCHAKHEQFSHDGKNRLMVLSGGIVELGIDGKEMPFPAGPPHTPSLSGHQAWIGTSNRICFTTNQALASWKASATTSAEIAELLERKKHPDGMIWSAKAGEEKPTLVSTGPRWFYHIGASKCGRYWIADTFEKDVPIYIGSFASGRWKRAVFSRTPTNAPESAGHTHPYMTADNKWLIFTSCGRDGHSQVYGAKLAEGWLEGL